MREESGRVGENSWCNSIAVLQATLGSRVQVQTIASQCMPPKRMSKCKSPLEYMLVCRIYSLGLGIAGRVRSQAQCRVAVVDGILGVVVGSVEIIGIEKWKWEKGDGFGIVATRFSVGELALRMGCVGRRGSR